MASYTWGLLCRRVIIDQQTNAVSYIDALEAFSAARLPQPAPPIIAGTLWWRTSDAETSIEARAWVESPSGESLMTKSVKLDLQPNHTRGRINIGLAGYEVVEPGRYHIVLEQRQGEDWIEVARLPFVMELAPETTEEQARTAQQLAPQQGARTRKRKGRGRKKQRT